MKRSNKGFTLIELMIVVAIIAIIAAIAIPSLLRSKMSANHSNAGAALKSLVTQESVWRSQDMDKNGSGDYWVLDCAAFHYAQDAAANKVSMIDQAFADADVSSAGGALKVGDVSPYDATRKIAAKQGYLFKAVTTDHTGAAYKVTTSGTNLLPAPITAKVAGNVARFGFTAYPSAYNTDGTLTFCVREDGVVFQKDIANSTGLADWSADGPSPGKGVDWAQFGQ